MTGKPPERAGEASHRIGAEFARNDGTRGGVARAGLLGRLSLACFFGDLDGDRGGEERWGGEEGEEEEEGTSRERVGT